MMLQKTTTLPPVLNQKADGWKLVLTRKCLNRRERKTSETTRAVIAVNKVFAGTKHSTVLINRLYQPHTTQTIQNYYYNTTVQ